MEFVYRLNAIANVAGKIVELMNEATVFAFDGEMGAGKTTLIHAICNQLGTEGNFGSPTFSIINEYGSARGAIYHIDLYRCKSEDEAIRAGVEDCLYSGNICMVEWPSKAPGIFPDDTVRVSIQVSDEFTRTLKISAYSDNQRTSSPSNRL